MTVKVKNLQPFHPAILGGWNNLSGSLNQTSVVQNITAIQDSEDFYYISTNNGGAANNVFRFAAKSAPTVWTNTVFPVSDDLNTCYVDPTDTDKVYIGTTDAANGRAYRFSKSTGLFTNLNFPVSGSSDAVVSFLSNPEDPNTIFVGNQCQAAAGGARLYRLDKTTLAWTLLNEFGTLTNKLVQNIAYSGGRLYVAFSGGAANIARVMLSSGSPFTIWGQIAGDTVNGSWATATYRGLRVIVLNGVLYASLSGASNGDAETWRATDLLGSSWTKIGGDGVNGSWAAGTKVNARVVSGRGNLLVVGTTGGAGDGEVWQWNNNTSVWTKVMGDGVNGTWAARNAVGALHIDREGRLLAGAGNNAVNSSDLYRTPGGFASPANQGSGYGQIAIRL